jgi:predicted aspartyl protease
MTRVIPRTIASIALLATLGLGTSADAQGPPTSTCQPLAAATAPEKGQPIVAPVEISNNHVFVRVCAKGTPLDFILDTGAGATYFDLNHAKALGLKTGSAFTVRGAGAGTVAGGRVDGGSVTLLGTGIEQAVSSVIDLSALPSREGHRMDGILGYDFISRFVIAIDYVRAELRLYDPSSFQYSGPGTAIPVTFFSNHPHIDTDVRLADGTMIPGRMIVDVGSAGSLSLAKPFVDQHRLRDRVGPTVKRRSGGGVGAAAWTDVGRIAGLRIGNLEIDRPTTTLFGDSAGVFTTPGTWVGNIGGDILRRFTVFLDYKHNRMILEPHAGTNEAFESDMSGITFVMDDSLRTLIVNAVVPDSPAGDAGIAPRDTITAIDGRPATSDEYRELRKRLRREGERVSFTIRRGGETKTVVIVTRRLI